jgi:hypothetical protein
MSSIPPDIYARVHELALALVNALDAGDDVLHDSLLLTLRAYYDEQASLGRSHPFLTEALADQTDDPADAIRLYQLSLTQSLQFPDEHTHTKHISLADHLITLGHPEQAEAHLLTGRAEALRLQDDFWIKEADRLIHSLPN